MDRQQKSGSTFKWIFIIILVLCIAAAICGIIWYLNSTGVFDTKYDTSKHGPCGTVENGGIEKIKDCCYENINFCLSSCKPDEDPNGCLIKCLSNRGCSEQLKCTDFGSFSTGLGNTSKCGTEFQGSDECKPKCCKSQVYFCKNNCKADIDPNGCLVRCMQDRGCGEEIMLDSIECTDLGTFSTGFGNTSKCETIFQGGDKCKKECCTGQVKFCRINCKADGDPNGCLVRCMRDRGCSDSSIIDSLQCSDLGTFSTGLRNTSKCETIFQGGDKCKIPCCIGQVHFCRTNCIADGDPNGCLVRCIQDRGCSDSSIIDSLQCNDLGTFSTGLRNTSKCETVFQGGNKCKSECCTSQQTYCTQVALLPSTRKKCMSDRGC